MKTKTLKKNKVNVVTLGCSKNIFDSEVMMAQLKANKFEVEHEAEQDDSEIVIINTCGFIDNAKQESIDTILRYADAKNEGAVDKVYVTGCLSERYKDDLESEIPEVDAFFGTRELPRLLKTLKADYKHELVGERLLTTPSHYAYFKIAEGCDRPCSFCAIPLMRGKHKSTPIEELVEQAKGLAAKGVKELMLIAQDLTYYGLDLYGKRNLAELIDKLADVEGIEWIKLHYAFPAGFPMDVLDVMNKRENVCNYLDIPLQHGSTSMLKAMRRGITREKTEALIEKMRETVPGIAICWTKELLEDIPVVPQKHTVFRVKCPKYIKEMPLSGDLTTGVYWRPEGGEYLAGSPNSVFDAADLEPAWNDFEELVWPALAKRIPAFEELKLTGGWAGYYDCNKLDNNAVVGKHPKFENVYMASGFTGRGLMQAPGIGRALTELITTGSYQTIDISDFVIERVLGKLFRIE